MLAINSNNNQKTSFCGLTRYLQKTVFSCEDVKKLAKEVFHNSFAGNLPSEWIEKIPRNQRGQTIQEVFQGFRKFINLLNEKPEIALSELEVTLKKAGILSAEKNLDLKFEGSGTYGKVYLLDGLENEKTGEKYVIKIFGSRGEHAKANGVFAELNRGGLYWPKAAGKNTQMVKTFFGDLESGFVVNKFIDYSIPEPKKIIPSKLLGLESYDDEPKFNVLHNIYSENKINGYVVDQGCLRVECPEITTSKDARYVLKKIFFTPKDKISQKWFEFLNSPSYKNNASVRVALIEAIEYLPPEDRAGSFNNILEKFSKDKNVRYNLAKNIKFIQDSDFADCFQSLWKKSEALEKSELIKNIDILPQNIQNRYIVKALEEKALINQVIERFEKLPQEELIPLFNLAIKTSNDEGKISLFQKMFLLPAEKRLELTKGILQGLEDENKLKFIEQKSFLLGLNNVQDYKKAYEYLITDAGNITKIFIINNILKHLKNDDYLEAFKSLAKNSDETVKFKLAPLFKELINEKTIKKEDAEFIYNEMSKNTFKQSYLDYLKEILSQFRAKS